MPLNSIKSQDPLVLWAHTNLTPDEPLEEAVQGVAALRSSNPGKTDEELKPIIVDMHKQHLSKGGIDTAALNNAMKPEPMQLNNPVTDPTAKTPEGMLASFSPEARAAVQAKADSENNSARRKIGDALQVFSQGFMRSPDIAGAIRNTQDRADATNAKYLGEFDKNREVALADFNMDRTLKSDQLVQDETKRKQEQSRKFAQAIHKKYPEIPVEELEGKDALELAKLVETQKTNRMDNSSPAKKDQSYWWTAQRKGALSDERVAPFIKQGIGLKQAGDMLKLVESGNSVAAAGLGIKMAKAMGEVGAMTEKDVTRYVKSGKLTQGAGDKLRMWTEGTPSDATQEELKQIINVLNAEYNQQIVPVYNEWIDSAAEISKGRGDNISRDEVARRLALSGTTKEAGVDPNQELGGETAGSNPIKKETKEQLVERKTKDGRIGLFDPKTKAFVRYKT